MLTKEKMWHGEHIFFLFTLYTSDFQHNTDKCLLQKFSDDSSTVGYIIDNGEEEVERFVQCCETNHLQLNINKTREMVVEEEAPCTHYHLEEGGGEVGLL